MQLTNASRKSRLNKLSFSGKGVRDAILLQLSMWFNRTHNGELTYRTTQLITGYGCFADFLFMIGKYATPICGFCNTGRDSVQHTLQFCSAWEKERILLKSHIGEDLSLRTIINRILLSKDNWLVFQDFAENVMVKKENREKKEEETRRTQIV